MRPILKVKIIYYMIFQVFKHSKRRLVFYKKKYLFIYIRNILYLSVPASTSHSLLYLSHISPYIHPRIPRSHSSLCKPPSKTTTAIRTTTLHHTASRAITCEMKENKPTIWYLRARRRTSTATSTRGRARRPRYMYCIRHLKASGDSSWRWSTRPSSSARGPKSMASNTGELMARTSRWAWGREGHYYWCYCWYQYRR